MDPRVDRSLTYGRAIVHEVRAERLTFLAGSIAYHAFVSLLPLLVLVLALITTIGDRSLEQGLLALTAGVLTPGAADVLLDELRRAGASTGLSLIGLAVLIWGTLRIFRGLDTAFSVIYETEAANTLFDQVRDGLVVLVVVALAIMAAVVVEARFGIGGGTTQGWVLHRFALAAALVVVLFPMYYVFPDADLGILEILPGTVTAAVGLTAFESLFRLYLDVGGTDPDATALAGILVFLTWLYVSGFVILFGAAVNAVTSNRSRDVNVEPLFGGLPIDEAPQQADRDGLLTDLAQLESLIDGADGVDVETDGGRVSLPKPNRVAVDRGTISGVFGDGSVGIELRWTPREE